MATGGCDVWDFTVILDVDAAKAFLADQIANVGGCDRRSALADFVAVGIRTVGAHLYAITDAIAAGIGLGIDDADVGDHNFVVAVAAQDSADFLGRHPKRQFDLRLGNCCSRCRLGHASQQATLGDGLRRGAQSA